MNRVGRTEAPAPPETKRAGIPTGEGEGSRRGGEVERDPALMRRVTWCSSRIARFSCEVVGTKLRLLTIRTRGAGNPRFKAVCSKESPQLRHSDCDISTQDPPGSVRSASVSCGSPVRILSVSCGPGVTMFHHVNRT